MNCPHCGKAIENTITVNMPANINACNPIIPTFQLFPFANVNAAAGNPLLNGTVIDYTTCAAPAPNPIIVKLNL